MNFMSPDEPRNPRKVRFWGWVAFGVAVVIAIVYLLLGHPWNKRHSSTGSAPHGAHVLMIQARPAGRYD
jgi:hypothetical protein